MFRGEVQKFKRYKFVIEGTVRDAGHLHKQNL